MDDLVNRLRDDAGCSQGTCLSCTKGFENHEYGCTEGEYWLDSVAVLKKTRKRLRKVSLEAAARIIELESALKPFANEAKLWPDFQKDDLPLECKGLPSWEKSAIALGDLRRAAKLLNHRNA